MLKVTELYCQLIILAALKNLNPNKENVDIHHIIPKCCGGTDDPGNLIILDLAEHTIAHNELYKANPDIKELLGAALLTESRLEKSGISLNEKEKREKQKRKKRKYEYKSYKDLTEEQKEKRRAAHRKYRKQEKVKQQEKEYNEKWKNKNPNYYKNYQKDWNNKNPDYQKEYQKKYREAHKKGT